MVLVTTHGSRRDPRAAHGGGAPGHPTHRALSRQLRATRHLARQFLSPASVGPACLRMCVNLESPREANKRSGPFLRARVPAAPRSSQRAARGLGRLRGDGHRLVARAGPVPARIWNAFPWP